MARSATGQANVTDPRSCPSCGSTDLLDSLRDTTPEPGTILPPDRGFGHWVVCQSCGHEWRPDGGRHGEGRKEATDG